MSFERRLTEFLERERPASRTPAWILSELLIAQIEAFDRACLLRDEVVEDRRERIELVREGNSTVISGAVTVIHPSEGAVS